MLARGFSLFPGPCDVLIPSDTISEIHNRPEFSWPWEFGGHQENDFPPHPATLFCHSTTGGWCRLACHTSAIRTWKHWHNGDLYAYWHLDTQKRDSGASSEKHEEVKRQKKVGRRQILHSSLFTLHFFLYLCTQIWSICHIYFHQNQFQRDIPTKWPTR